MQPGGAFLLWEATSFLEMNSASENKLRVGIGLCAPHSLDHNSAMLVPPSLLQLMLPLTLYTDEATSWILVQSFLDLLCKLVSVCVFFGVICPDRL